MLQTYDRRRFGGPKRKRQPNDHATTDRYKRRAYYDNLKVGNMHVGSKPWSDGEDDLLLKDLTHREIVLEIFAKFGVRRSRPSVMSRCYLIKKKLANRVTPRKYKSIEAFIKRKKLTKKNFRPFDEGHMYGYLR